MSGQLEARAVVTLVGCAKLKRKRSAPARELYVSRQFEASMELASELGHPVRILSALHGVVELDDVLAPYDETQITADWGVRVVAQLAELGAARFVVLAGSRYAKPLASLELHTPLAGLEIGERFVETGRILARVRGARSQPALFRCALCSSPHHCWYWQCVACGHHGMQRVAASIVGGLVNYEAEATEQLAEPARNYERANAFGQLDLFGATL